MAKEVRTFQVTVAIGSTALAPVTTALTMPGRLVRAVRVRTPPGPRGQVGWQLASGGVQMIPWASGTYMVTDDEVIDWPLDGQIETGAWQLRAYNTGDYPHTLFIAFQLDPLPSRSVSSSPSQPLNLEA